MTYGSAHSAEDFSGLNDWAEFHQRYAGDEVALKTTLRAAIYCRRSSTDPGDKSIGRQLEVCTAHCRAEGFIYDTDRLLFVDVDRSGATMDRREGLHAALAAGERGDFDILVFEQVDRLTRDVLDAHRIRIKLKLRNIKLHAAGIGEVKLVPLTLRAFHAERERKRTTGLLIDGRLKAAAAGAYLGRTRIFGYRCLQTERTWAIDEHEASVLREMYRWIDEDDSSLNAVCTRLKAMGVAPAKGTRWDSARLYKREGTGLLQNTLVKGVWRYAIGRPEPVEIALPQLAILGSDLFDRVNAKLDRRSAAQKPKSAPRPYLLSGTLKCAVCGGPMKDAPVNKKYRWISCNAAFLGRCTERVSFKTSTVERQFLLTIKDDLLHEDRREEWNTRRAHARHALDLGLAPARATLEAELRAVSGRLEDLRRSENALPPLMRLAIADEELTHNRLVHALDDLSLPARIVISDEEAVELRSGISKLLMRLPTTPDTAVDLSLFARLRTLLPQVTLAQEKDGGGYRMRFRIGIVNGREPKVDDDRGVDHLIERIIPYPGRGSLNHPEKIIAWHEAAAAGAFELSDEDWAAISHLFKSFRLKNESPRSLAEALVMIATTGIPQTLLPERYAHAANRVLLVSKLGIWREVMGILRQRRSARVEGLDPQRFDHRPRPRRDRAVPR